MTVQGSISVASSGFHTFATSVIWAALNVSEGDQNSHALLYTTSMLCKININIQIFLPIMKVTLAHGYTKIRGSDKYILIM